MRRNQASAFANPVMIGAVTVLTALVGVFLAYSANTGLPFVPTKLIKLEVPDGSNLVDGNDVREGGFRVGFVSELKPVTLRNGSTVAQISLKLDKSHGTVPVDSRFVIRTRSVLGLKYIDLQLGRSSQLVADGGTVVLGPKADPVQFDQIFDTFNTPTRTAIKHDLTLGGDALAGRGADFNNTIQSLPELLRHLTPVATYLANPASGLTPFFKSLNTFIQTVAPVANVNARLFTDMATTFGAIAKDPNALQSTISESPSTLDVSTDSLRSQMPFLTSFASLGTALGPATASLRAALPNINPALEAGARTLSQTPPLNSRLQGVFVSLKRLAQAPGTNYAINGLADTTAILNPFIKYEGPFITVCNDWNYWWTFLSEHLSEKTSFGFAQRALINTSDNTQNNNVSQQGATSPANGGGGALNGGNQFLHGQAYGAAIDNSGNADCETGQRGYPQKLNHSDPQSRNLATDIHTPGNQGTTFTGRDRVPAGETFSRAPVSGVSAPFSPLNP